MRIVTYNVEWMDHLFDDAGALRDDDGWSGRHDIRRADQIAALLQVFRALDADLVLVVEAPDASRRRDGAAALERFAAHAGIRARQSLIGFPNHTQQEIAVLWDPDRLTLAHDPGGGPGANPRFDASYRIDLDIDARLDRVEWSKPPLELDVLTAAGTRLRMIGVHAKSKAPHGVRRRAEFLRKAIANRRKQLAQCIWLRARIDELLADGNPLIVLGDFNDGPGLDEYERLFGRSGIEIVLGEDGQVPLYDPHAAMATGQRIGAMPATARFWQGAARRYLSVLLDYVMVSPDLRDRAPHWRIWHPFDDPDCYGDPALCRALLTASDHFPVSLDIAI